jgi:type II secretory pathway component GspD/PulD (secretin)
MSRLRFASFGLALVACLTSAQGADLGLEVIQLRYRTAEQVLPVLQPLVPKPGTLSGMNNSLIVRTTPSNLAEIRRVLESIDRLPRRLMITVRQDAEGRRDESGAELSGTIGSRRARVDVPGSRDERAGARVNAGGGDDRVSARIYGTQSLANDRSSQQVQVLEGNEAFIRVGQSVPVSGRSIVREAVGGRVIERSVDTVEYRDILSGFHVRPRVAGDIVTLDVSPQRDTAGDQGRGSMNVQRLSTTISGRLGEWIELGGVTSGQSFEGSGTVYRTNAANADQRRILLRVDEVHESRLMR